jgi:hypothetical protein
MVVSPRTAQRSAAAVRLAVEEEVVVVVVVVAAARPGLQLSAAVRRAVPAARRSPQVG